MTVAIPADLEQSLASRAATLGVPADDLVRQALRWYLAVPEAVWEEFDAWQEIRDEALELIERPDA